MMIAPGVIASSKNIQTLVESIPAITWPADSGKTENWAIGLLDSLRAWQYLHQKLGYWDYVDDAGGIQNNKTASPTYVSLQRGGLWLIRHGFTMASAGHTQSDYILRGTSAFEWAWDRFNSADGYFYNGAGADPVLVIESDIFFLSGFVNGRLLINGEPSLSSLSTSYAAYNTALGQALAWQETNLTQILSDGAQTPNRLLFAAVAHHLGGKAISSTTARDRGEAFANTAGARMDDDGWFNEKGGWDSSYQGVCLMNLCTLFFHTDQAGFKVSVKAYIGYAAAWLYTRVSDVGANVGYINTDGNTRTGPNGEIGPSGKPKQVNYSECALAMFYAGCIHQNTSYIICAMNIVTYAANNG